MDKDTESSYIGPITENTALISLEYKLNATVALDEGNFRNAIYYQTQSLGASKRKNYSEISRKRKDIGALIDVMINSKNGKRKNDVLLSHIGFTEICKRCDELPQEWTVIQIAKQFSPVATCMTHEELLQEPTPIWITIFRCSDPCEGSKFEPILIALDPPDNSDCSIKYQNIFEHIVSIPSEVRKAIAGKFPSTQGKSPSSQLEDVEHLIGSAIQRVSEWLGPWSNLFIGKFRSKSEQKLEHEIYSQIENFCVHNGINRTNQRLVSLVARRLDLLEDVQLYELCCSDQLSLDDAKIETLYAFLSDLKRQKFNEKMGERLDCYPVMLIIDELLDTMPWEMIHSTGEFCRFGSFWSLSNLYRTHAKRIKNGYFCMSAKTCCAIINPDKNLDKMSARLQMFYKEWNPDFRLLIDQAPTESEFSELLNKSDVLIYNGHGSGLQFMNGESLMQRDINCVTFLFGCDSVRLHSNGLFTEMTGSHLYYGSARCPAVIGALWVLTDLFTDIYSMLLVGNWIPSTNSKYDKKKICSLDMVAFKECNWQFNKTSSSAKLLVNTHPNLVKLMGDCRMFHQLPQRIRCALVCRGLPVMNEACN
ncbi:uncharacterized protein LOC128730493 [Anopheles nili]|uniref:uncharacterized protein LOC128730493 n=1 Tax=Anopheles nili TaxID=185578 RepID=UPI00237B512F|nr:uncharacterized protein LOC128730493 [Anopheles nili]